MRWSRLSLSLAIALMAFSPCFAADSAFVAPPYIQLGTNPAPGTATVVWHGSVDVKEWAFQYQASPNGEWKGARIESNLVEVEGVTPHRVYRVALSGLLPGGTFKYIISKGNQPVFSAEAKALKGPNQPQHFAVMGDCGAGTPEQKMVADALVKARPDFLFITGDIVYSRGRISEYAKNYWPIYNDAGSTTGQALPLLRSTLTIAAAGNHDIASRDLTKQPDGLAYFHYWDQPLNGPLDDVGGPIAGPLQGTDAQKDAFLKAAGARFPRMANFSFDVGDAHWLVLDANGYVDMKNPQFQDWIARDLAAARSATWRFVAFHQPGFNSSKSHFDEQRTRLLATLFEAGKVDVVFAGHVHNYQRTFPLTFQPDGKPVYRMTKGTKTLVRESVSGVWTLDKEYDGKMKTRPKGVIYIVTGAGGQHLYNPEQQDKPETWQPFTHTFISKVHSFTVVDLDGKTLTARQLDLHGAEVDRFRIEK